MTTCIIDIARYLATRWENKIRDDIPGSWIIKKSFFVFMFFVFLIVEIVCIMLLILFTLFEFLMKRYFFLHTSQLST